MLTYSTCATCKEALSITWVGQQTHPNCEQTPEELKLREFVDALQRGDQTEADKLEKQINQTPAPKLGSSALWYAGRGWPVFPLYPNSKQPAVSKKDGGHGLHDATTDLEQVQSWWAQWPEANIGLPTGINFDVIDIDGPTGIQSLTELGEGVLPDVHGKVGTPRGFHLYVEKTGDGNRAGVRPGIDYRGAGGYVVGAPSRIDFKTYSWLVKPSPAIIGGASVNA